MYICSICKKHFTDFGNNPWPVTKGENDRCCDGCNSEVVIPRRIYLLMHKDEVEDERE